MKHSTHVNTQIYERVSLCVECVLVLRDIFNHKRVNSNASKF